MHPQLRLLCVLAHPDDESLGLGGLFARYAAEGVETSLLVATRGQQGWLGTPETHPGYEALGAVRERELRAAAEVLGIRNLRVLDYLDGKLAEAEPEGAIAAIAAYIRRVKPDVVVTFGPEGATGHPDHIAIAQFTTAAIVQASDDDILPGHQVAKLYYLAESSARVAAYEVFFGPLAMTVDGLERRVHGLPDWVVTTRIDSADYWRQVWQAVACHRSQLPNFNELEHLTEAQQRELWGCQELYRVFSLVNGGREIEDDIFAGLRVPAAVGRR